MITSKLCRITGFCCVLLCLGAAMPLAAQTGSPAGQVTLGATTRLAAQWAEQENALDEALARRDAPQVTQLLASEFEFHATTPARHWGANDWLRQERRVSAANRQLRELQVRELSAVTLVSFVRVAGASTWRAEFVVDVWRTSDHKLLARYASPAWKTPAVDTKPDGRH